MIEKVMKLVKYLGHKDLILSEALAAVKISPELFETIRTTDYGNYFSVRPLYDEIKRDEFGTHTVGQRLGDNIKVSPEGLIAFDEYSHKVKNERELRRDRWITRGFAFVAVVVSILALYVSWLAYTRP